MGFRSWGLTEWVILLAALYGVAFLAGRVSKKAGYSRWWGILFVVPLANVAWVWYLAHADWPALRRPGSGVDDTRRWRGPIRPRGRN
jgi:hypothetical protein